MVTTASLFGPSPNVVTSAPLFGPSTMTTTSLFAPTTSMVTTASLFGPSPNVVTSAPLFGPSTMTTTSLFAPTTSMVTTASLFGPSPNVVTSAPLLGSIAYTTTTSSEPISSTSVLNFRDLSTALLRMRIDFEEQEKQFLDEVDDLNAFDIILRKAQEKLSKIRNDVDEIEQEKLRFYWETDILAQQQEELEKIVKSFESQLQTQSISTISGSQDNATPADVERRNILRLQISVNTQLKLLDDEIGNICGQISDFQRIGGVSSSTIIEDREDSDEKKSLLTSIEQIRQILRSQLESLVWVDKHSDALLERVKRATSDILSMK